MAPPSLGGAMLPRLLHVFERVRGVEAVPSGANGVAVLRPFELRVAPVALVVALQVALDLLVRAAGVAPAPFPAGAIARVVIVEGIAALVVRLARVLRAPIRLFGRWIDLLGDSLAGKPSDDGTDRGARQCTSGSGYGA